MRITRLLLSAIVASVVLLTASCDKVDNHRLPPANVNILFNTIGDWQLYGVSGAGQTRDFIRQESQPAGYPYKAGEYTGFGGVMLVCDPNGEYLAFDLACPVEKKADIRVKYDTESTIAGIVKCPKCGQWVEVFVLMGGPVGKTGTLAGDEICACGHILPAGSFETDYKE